MATVGSLAWCYVGLLDTRSLFTRKHMPKQICTSSELYPVIILPKIVACIYFYALESQIYHFVINIIL